MVEYVGMSVSDQIEGKKSLLYAQMELLTIAKRYETYKKLRKQELALKRMLKIKVSEMHEELKKFSDLLPKTKEDVMRPVMLDKAKKKRSELEDQIEDIKRKIADLQ